MACSRLLESAGRTGYGRLVSQQPVWAFMKNRPKSEQKTQKKLWDPNDFFDIFFDFFFYFFFYFFFNFFFSNLFFDFFNFCTSSFFFRWHLWQKFPEKLDLIDCQRRAHDPNGLNGRPKWPETSQNDPKGLQMPSTPAGMPSQPFGNPSGTLSEPSRSLLGLERTKKGLERPKKDERS